MKENKKIDNVCKSQSIGDVDEMIQPWWESVWMS
jgi:hypothetical protein